jgi:hypothetical protein
MTNGSASTQKLSIAFAFHLLVHVVRRMRSNTVRIVPPSSSALRLYSLESAVTRAFFSIFLDQLSSVSRGITGFLYR